MLWKNKRNYVLAFVKFSSLLNRKTNTKTTTTTRLPKSEPAAWPDYKIQFSFAASHFHQSPCSRNLVLEVSENQGKLGLGFRN
ncbi:hypothetical protein Peur_071548 [Populus x canadensis]